VDGVGENVTYYQEVADAVKSLRSDWLVVFNPGTTVSVDIARIADITVLFENTRDIWLQYTPPSFMNG
jgi:hypothetical protein